jgi:thiol-disulfide isomerase/thioredoxin
MLEEMAAELGDQVTIAKLNVDEHPDIAMRYSVMSIPTLLIFDDGDVKKKIVGAKGKGAPGQRGEAIRDLQRRLGAAGFPPAGAEAGFFCVSTEAALRSFQEPAWPAGDGRVRRGHVAGDRRGVLEARRSAARAGGAQPAR